MVEVTQALAERISGITRLLDSDDEGEAALSRLSGLGVDLVPGVTGAAVTIAAGGQRHTFAASDARIGDLHQMQFAAGQGPVVETLRYNETRHVRDTSADDRWLAFCRAACQAGFSSLITMPLHTGQQPAGAVALYADRPGAFNGAAHDIALLFAAQGGTAVHNAEVYGACRDMVGNLQADPGGAGGYRAGQGCCTPSWPSRRTRRSSCSGGPHRTPTRRCASLRTSWSAAT